LRGCARRGQGCNPVTGAPWLAYYTVRRRATMPPRWQHWRPGPGGAGSTGGRPPTRRTPRRLGAATRHPRPPAPLRHLLLLPLGESPLGPCGAARRSAYGISDFYRSHQGGYPGTPMGGRPSDERLPGPETGALPALPPDDRRDRRPLPRLSRSSRPSVRSAARSSATEAAASRTDRPVARRNRRRSLEVAGRLVLLHPFDPVHG